MLFSPARVIITTIKTGKSFSSGALDLNLVDKSFNR